MFYSSTLSQHQQNHDLCCAFPAQKMPWALRRGGASALTQQGGGLGGVQQLGEACDCGFMCAG